MTGRTESIRCVVFHADDFGMNASVNGGILTAFHEGLLTSTSLLANSPAAEAACQAWPSLMAELNQGIGRHSGARRDRFEESPLPFDLGIHLNLTQGRPLTGEQFPKHLLDPYGNFPGIGTMFRRLFRVGPSVLASVEAELYAQVEWMCDRGLRPTHLNGHQYVELIPVISAMLPGILKKYAIPIVRVAFERGLIRNVLSQGDISGFLLAGVKRCFAMSFRHRINRIGISSPDRFFGTAHAGRIKCRQVFQFLDQSSGARCVEIGVHPAAVTGGGEVSAEEAWFDPLSKLRPNELEWLCSSELSDGLASRGWHLGRLQSLSGNLATTSHSTK